MAQHEPTVYQSGEWEVDLAKRELRARGIVVPLGSRAFDIIEVLILSNGQIVGKDKLIEHVWPGSSIVEDATIRVHISAIRKAFGASRKVLQTVQGQGYRLIDEWSPRRELATSEPLYATETSPPVVSYLTNVPAAASALLGREAAVRGVLELLSTYRAVTLTGAGGIGKTALASEVARRYFADRESDVFLIELASLSDPRSVPSKVASVLGLRLGADEVSATEIAAAIASTRVLLVLDNCEHVIEAVSALVEAFLRTCPFATVLTTSREGMRTEGEFVYQVAALEVPPPHLSSISDALRWSAVQLFVARVASLREELTLKPQDLSAISTIVRQLDGIPLAIEFAAARAATLGIEDVAERLGDRFALLTGGRRTALPRHRTLRATLDWSYQLLSPAEQRMLWFLAVFPGGFSLDAVTAVMDETHSRSDIVRDLSNLASKSLVSKDPHPDRWRLLDTTRAYALEKLADAELADQASRKHASFFRNLVTSSRERKPTSQELARYALEIGNVHAALDWAFSPAGDAALGIELTAAFVPVWMQLLSFAECSSRIEKAIAESRRLQLPTLEAELNVSLGFSLLNTTGSADRMKEALSVGKELAEQLGDLELQLKALWTLWSYNLNSGRYSAAQEVAEDYIRIARRTQNPSNESVGHRLLGAALHFRGEQVAAGRELALALRLPGREAIGPSNPMWFLLNQSILAKAMLARVMLLRGSVVQARALAMESMREAEVDGDKLSIAYALRNAVCPIALMTRDLGSADQAIARLYDLVTREGIAFWTGWTSCLKGQLLVGQKQWTEGISLLRSGLRARAEHGWLMRNPEFMGSLAEGLLGAGELPSALSAVQSGLEIAVRGDQLWCQPHLLHMKAQILSAESGSETEVERLLLEGMLLARRQSSSFYELSIAASLARHLMRSGRAHAAVDLLDPLLQSLDPTIDLQESSILRSLLKDARASV